VRLATRQAEEKAVLGNDFMGSREQAFRMTATAVVVLLVIALVPTCAYAGDGTARVAKGSPDVFMQKLGGESAKLDPNYKAMDTTYFIHVPDDYSKDRAYPLILVISPGFSGKLMYAPWAAAAQKYRIIFACPDKAGNEVPGDVRGQRVLDTLFDVQSRYNIDPEQIFVSGFSGGGRMSTAFVAAYPGFFAGHIPIGGIVYSNSGEEGLKKLKVKIGHYVFCGEKCFNREESEAAKKAMKDAGMTVELMVGPGLKHAMPNAQQALAIFDWFMARSPAAMKAKFDAAEKHEKAGRPGAALKGYESMVALGGNGDWVGKAKERAAAICAEAEKCMADADAAPTPDAMARLRKCAKELEGTETGKKAAKLAATLEKNPRTAEEAKKAAVEKTGR
jgi:hypothetical protein